MRPVGDVDYREHAPAPHLAGLIKTFWTLDAGGEGGQWIEQQATPDGCVEIIRRLSGRSRWNGDQPELFMVGLIEAPEPFAISGDSRFAAVRLWPWAWSLLGAEPLDQARGRWRPFDGAVAHALPDFTAVEKLLGGRAELESIGRAIVAAETVQAMGATGMSPRTLQRWFARHVGMSVSASPTSGTAPGADSLTVPTDPRLAAGEVLTVRPDHSSDDRGTAAHTLHLLGACLAILCAAAVLLHRRGWCPGSTHATAALSPRLTFPASWLARVLRGPPPRDPPRFSPVIRT